jgi:hypothetical protein
MYGVTTLGRQTAIIQSSVYCGAPAAGEVLLLPHFVPLSGRSYRCVPSTIHDVSIISSPFIPCMSSRVTRSLCSGWFRRPFVRIKLSMVSSCVLVIHLLSTCTPSPTYPEPHPSPLSRRVARRPDTTRITDSEGHCDWANVYRPPGRGRTLGSAGCRGSHYHLRIHARFHARHHEPCCDVVSVFCHAHYWCPFLCPAHRRFAFGASPFAFGASPLITPWFGASPFTSFILIPVSGASPFAFGASPLITPWFGASPFTSFIPILCLGIAIRNVHRHLPHHLH